MPAKRVSFQLRHELLKPVIEKAVELGYPANRFMTECVRDCLLQMEAPFYSCQTTKGYNCLTVVSEYRAVTGRENPSVQFAEGSPFHGLKQNELIEQSRRRLAAVQKKKLPARLTGMIPRRIAEEVKDKAEALRISTNDFVNRCVEGVLTAMDADADGQKITIILAYRDAIGQSETLWVRKAFDPSYEPEGATVSEQVFNVDVSDELNEFVGSYMALAEREGIDLKPQMLSLLVRAYRDFRREDSPGRLRLH